MGRAPHPASIGQPRRDFSAPADEETLPGHGGGDLTRVIAAFSSGLT